MTAQAFRLSADQASEAYNPFVDPAGLGVRTIGCDTFSGELLEVLRLTSDLGTPDEIEPLVRERCEKFAEASLAGLAPIMRVERTFDGRLELWSRLADGFRLSAVLEWAEARGAAPSLDTALTIGDRLLSSLASLQSVEQVDGASGHGAIAIDQIVVSESGSLTLTDYAYGTTLAALQWPRERLWRRFRIAMPPSAGLARFDHRVDVTQAAMVITSLLAGRVLKQEEYPGRLPAIVSEAVNRSCAGIDLEDRGRLTMWLTTAIEFGARGAFRSAAHARDALRESLGHRLDDTAGVGRWLRQARGIPEQAAPSPVLVPPARPAVTAEIAEIKEATASEPASPREEPRSATPSEPAARVRKWLSRW